jgi:hypothetical protein
MSMSETAEGVAARLLGFIRAEEPPPNTVTTQPQGNALSQTLVASKQASGPRPIPDMVRTYGECLTALTGRAGADRMALDCVIRELARLIGVPG